MNGSCTFILPEPNMDTSPFVSRWLMVWHEIFTVLKGVVLFCKAVRLWHPSSAKIRRSPLVQTNQLAQSRRADAKSKRGLCLPAKGKPLWMIAAGFVARRDVRVVIHGDASTYGNERKHQKSGAACESSFNQEVVRTASEATIMWEVAGLTQEVWWVHLARLITNINHSVVCSALRSCSCWRLLIFHGGQENATNIFTTSLSATPVGSYGRAEFQLLLKLSTVCGSSCALLLCTNVLCKNFPPFYLSGKRQTTKRDTRGGFWAGTQALKMSSSLIHPGNFKWPITTDFVSSRSP